MFIRIYISYTNLLKICKPVWRRVTLWVFVLFIILYWKKRNVNIPKCVNRLSKAIPVALTEIHVPAIFSTVSYRWIALPLPHHKSEERQCVPYQRYGHTAVAVGDCAYIWGGRNDKDGACNVLFCFDSSKCTYFPTKNFSYLTFPSMCR